MVDTKGLPERPAFARMSDTWGHTRVKPGALSRIAVHMDKGRVRYVLARAQALPVKPSRTHLAGRLAERQPERDASKEHGGQRTCK